MTCLRFSNRAIHETIRGSAPKVILNSLNLVLAGGMPAERSSSMTGLKILITSFMCAGRSGLEVYVRNLALELQKRGHVPIIYSPILGELAQKLRLKTIPVVDNLNAIGVFPDLIHGHHQMETMAALLHFPGVPAI